MRTHSSSWGTEVSRIPMPASGDPHPARPLDGAAGSWDAVAADTPDDVWVYNNAGLEYGAIAEHELALQ